MKFFQSFFQYSCIQCHTPLALPKQGLCSRCYQQISDFPHCGHCGAALLEYAPRCGNCQQSKHRWQQMVFVGRYSPPLSEWIYRFKFQKQFYLDRTLARLLLLSICNARRHFGFQLPDALLPVPLHHVRQWQRGYNQAYLLAQYLSHWLKIPVNQTALTRTKYTHTQRGLSAQARQHNLKNAFSINSQSLQNYQSVALIDDVITTGATLNEICLQLNAIGINKIQVWGLARA